MVGILMGSKSDLDVVRNAFDVLDSFGVPFKARILSAHRTPQEAAEFAENAEKNGIKGWVGAEGRCSAKKARGIPGKAYVSLQNGKMIQSD